MLALAACHDERQHVFQAPPPVPLPVERVIQAPTPDLPFGAKGPDARIVSVQSAATDAPIALTAIDDSMHVMTLVSQGPTPIQQDRGARIELLVSGASRAVFTRPLENPAPTTIAHVFTVPVSRGNPAGLQPGNYRMQVRLVMRDSTAVATSNPLVINIR
jgi:hypothetical protein